MVTRASSPLIFYEPVSNQIIHATEYDILYAKYHLNRNFALRGIASVNEFLAFLDTMPYNRSADSWGWNADYFIDCGMIPWIDIYYVDATRAGVPCNDIVYTTKPMRGEEFRGLRDSVDRYRRDWDPNGLIFNGTHPYKRVS